MRQVKVGEHSRERSNRDTGAAPTRTTLRLVSSPAQSSGTETEPCQGMVFPLSPWSPSISPWSDTTQIWQKRSCAREVRQGRGSTTLCHG